MKKLLIVLFVLGCACAFAQVGDENCGAFMYKGEKFSDNSDEARAFFYDFQEAEADICYMGDWTIAQDMFSDTLSFSIHEVSSNGTLSVEVYNPEINASANGMIPKCSTECNVK